MLDSKSILAHPNNLTVFELVVLVLEAVLPRNLAICSSVFHDAPSCFIYPPYLRTVKVILDTNSRV